MPRKKDDYKPYKNRIEVTQDELYRISEKRASKTPLSDRENEIISEALIILSNVIADELL